MRVAIALRSCAVLAEVDVGRLIAGKYELVRLIGKGAMGEVWLATHNSLGGEFAIKLVKPSDDEEDESAAGRFQLEAQISAKLSRRTRHIISVSDHGEEDGLAYLVMELLDGESLEARIKRAGELPLAEVVGIVTQISRALGQAHAESIFHRDLKPANVYITKDEDGRLLVKLLDFGIARSAKPFRTRSPFMTGKDMVLGTPSYMSPEQARGLDSLDHRCDLWALAVVAYESLTRSIPWEGETVEDIFLSICTHRMTPILARRKDLPPAIEAVFARSFAPKLDDRFRSAAELSEALEALVDPLDVDAAMGVRPTPASSRRLVAAPVAPAAPAAPNGGQHNTPQAMFLQPQPAGSDPVGVAVGGPTLHLRRRKRSSSGWLLGGVAAVATIGIVVLAVTTFSTRGTSTTTAPPNDTTAAPPNNDRSNIPPPSPAEPSTTTATPTPLSNTAPTPKATTPKATGVVARPTPPPVTPPVPPTPHVPPPVVAPAPPPVAHPAAPTPPPPAPPRKPPDKSEVL